MENFQENDGLEWIFKKLIMLLRLYELYGYHRNWSDFVEKSILKQHLLQEYQPFPVFYTVTW